MRIIAGTLKGRRLWPPPARGVRPTSDRLRETLFNVLREEVVGARMLDGFAGTGAVALEALSRGAVHATLVEHDSRALGVLGRNITDCGMEAAATIVRGDAVDFCRRASQRGAYDIVFLDPPYDQPDLQAIVEIAAPCVTAGGVLVLEHSSRRPSPDGRGGLEQTRRLVAGDSALTFYAASRMPAGV